MVKELSVTELKALRDAAGAVPLVLDVRESWELAIARLSGSLDIPMNEIPDRLGDIPRNCQINVLCRSGARSLRVAHYLEQNGFGPITNVTGGILAWSNEVDADVPQY